MSKAIEPVKPVSTVVFRSSVAVLIEITLPRPLALMPLTVATTSVPSSRAPEPIAVRIVPPARFADQLDVDNAVLP